MIIIITIPAFQSAFMYTKYNVGQRCWTVNNLQFYCQTSDRYYILICISINMYEYKCFLYITFMHWTVITALCTCTLHTPTRLCVQEWVKREKTKRAFSAVHTPTFRMFTGKLLLGSGRVVLGQPSHRMAVLHLSYIWKSYYQKKKPNCFCSCLWRFSSLLHHKWTVYEPSLTSMLHVLVSALFT